MPDYPGLGLPLRHLPQHGDKQYPVGAHGGCWGAESNMLPVREPAMMNIMDKLMDKEEWHRKIFDEAIVSKWREEALAIPDENFCKLAIRDKLQFWNYRDQVTLRDDGIPDNLELLAGVVSEGSFDYCVKELRSKAKYYEETSIIPTLDACASIPKSDNLVSTDLHNSLRNAFDMLKADQSSKQDWDPNSNEMVQDLVNPSMFPLVYGTTRVLKDELVGVDDAIEKWAGKGNRRAVSENVAKEFWSDTYQWLPTNVAFQDDGRVKFTSYISNLHPTKFPEIYRTIEKLIETSIPLWDQCIAFTAGYDKKYGAGRVTSRFPWPDNPDDENEENWIPSVPLRYKKVANKEVNQAKKGDGQKHENRDEDDINIEGIEDEEHYNEAESYHVWEQSRRPAIPELSFQDIEYAQEPEKCLSEKFRDSGLQVIVKMASIELTPENPEFPIGSWHDKMNEHICGTALYYLDSEDITSSDILFRMQTLSNREQEMEVGKGAYHWLEQVYGITLGGEDSLSMSPKLWQRRDTPREINGVPKCLPTQSIIIPSPRPHQARPSTLHRTLAHRPHATHHFNSQRTTTADELVG